VGVARAYLSRVWQMFQMLCRRKLGGSCFRTLGVLRVEHLKPLQKMFPEERASLERKGDDEAEKMMLGVLRVVRLASLEDTDKARMVAKGSIKMMRQHQGGRECAAVPLLELIKEVKLSGLRKAKRVKKGMMMAAMSRPAIEGEKEDREDHEIGEGGRGGSKWESLGRRFKV
jgi:hypothetical protein